MAGQESNEVNKALLAIEAGDPAAVSRLLTLVYTELRGVARMLMGKAAPGQTLQPTALVHEAYLRLVQKGEIGTRGRAHFFAAATQAMREILVEAARRKAALKRGGARQRQDLDPEALAFDAPPLEDLVALDEALKTLEKEDPRKGQIVNLKFFAGLEVEEIAEILGISEATVKRDWRYIRAWLGKVLSGNKTIEKIDRDPSA